MLVPCWFDFQLGFSVGVNKGWMPGVTWDVIFSYDQQIGQPQAVRWLTNSSLQKNCLLLFFQLPQHLLSVLPHSSMETVNPSKWDLI